MSILNLTNEYERLSKSYSLNSLVSQFSGVFLVDATGNIPTTPKYFIDDHAIKYQTVEATDAGPQIVSKMHRCWALPGYLAETINPPEIASGIELPTLPLGGVSTVPKDLILITTVPKYWYPEVPNGDSLPSYDLKFDAPFFDIKNNRQLFKVAQNNILDNGVIVIQLSALPAVQVGFNGSPSTAQVGFLNG